MKIDRLPSLLLVFCVLLPIPLGFVMSWFYDTVNDENIYFSLRWRIPGILLSACIVGVFVTFLISASFVLLLNGLASFGGPVRLEGAVLEKLRAGYRGKGPSVVITDTATGEQVKIYVSQRQWSSLAVGETFGRDIRKGLLGIRFYPSAYREG